MRADHEDFVEFFDYSSLNTSHVPGLELVIAWSENVVRINDLKLQLGVLLKIAKGKPEPVSSDASAPD